MTGDSQRGAGTNTTTTSDDDTAFVDTARYGTRLTVTAASRFAGLRPTVSYQNLSPSGEIFARERIGLNTSSYSGSVVNTSKCTTNVAWLVGAKTNAQQPNKPTTSLDEHHIDIIDKFDVQPPTNLEVAPLNNEKSSNITTAGVQVKELKTTTELSKVIEEKERANNLATTLNQWKVDLNHKKLAYPYNHQQPPQNLPITMGYTLARSKTISDIPQWATENDNAKSEKSENDNRYFNKVKSVGTHSTNSTQTNDSILDLNSSLDGSTYALQMGGHISTNGSLKSRIVKQRTLLRSQARLYKFSQSLSSLTTVGTESSRASSCDRGVIQYNLR